MLSEDQYMERTSDLVVKVRKVREAADKEMNRFTRVADYDARHSVGKKPKQTPQSGAELAPVKANGKSQKPSTQCDSRQLMLDIPSVPAEHGNDAEGA